MSDAVKSVVCSLLFVPPPLAKENEVQASAAHRTNLEPALARSDVSPRPTIASVSCQIANPAKPTRSAHRSSRPNGFWASSPSAPNWSAFSDEPVQATRKASSARRRWRRSLAA